MRRRPEATLTITLDSVKKMECGNGPRPEGLVPLWPQMTAAGRNMSLLVIQQKFVLKLIIFIEINTGTLTMSGAMLNIRLEWKPLLVDTYVKICKESSLLSSLNVK